MVVFVTEVRVWAVLASPTHERNYIVVVFVVDLIVVPNFTHDERGNRETKQIIQVLDYVSQAFSAKELVPGHGRLVFQRCDSIFVL